MRQLIFTSACAGLAPGRSGFCTVARHASLRERTVAELEKMSVYEPPEGSRPTVFLFRSYSGGNEKLYILTRAGDAGTDDFGRPNSVVHHLIFHESEIPSLLPPAEIALRFRGWCEKFSGAPRFLDDDESLPQEILRRNGESLLPARRWEALTGDAGNAALLCPRGDARAVVFIGDESMTETVLGLFAESSETLGAENSWGIAFSTGICSKYGAGRFLWRMIEDKNHGVLRPGDFVLDFLAPLSVLRAPKTAFAECARTGTPPENFSRESLPKKSEEDAAKDVPEEKLSPPQLAPEADVPAPAPENLAENSSAEDASPKRFSDIAGTAKFLGISAVVVALIFAVAFLLFPGAEKNPDASGEPAEIVHADPVAAYRAALDARVDAGDFAGAAEVWISFAETFPQDAARLRGSAFPRFKLKVADAFAERISRRMLAVDFGGKLSSEEKMLLAADLAMFTRVCKELELTPGRLQKRNLAVFERARALLAEDVPATAVPASPKE